MNPRALLHRHSRQAVLVAALGLSLSPASFAALQGDPCEPPNPPPACDGDIPAGKARVWRDENGVPHIEAATETAAWKAMGYEEARDALFSVQANIKRYRGHFAKYFGSGSLPVDDVAVRYLRLNLGVSLTGNPTQKENKLKTLLRRTNAPAGREHQVFDNLKAYAQGLESYRQYFAQTPMGSLNLQEQEYRAWLDDPDLDGDGNPLTGANFKWVYTEIDPVSGADLAAISVFDVASAGGWNSGTDHFRIAGNKDPRAAAASTEGFLTSAEANSHPPFLDLADGPLMGSNSFAWMNSSNLFYMLTPFLGGLFRGALVADPHQGYYVGGFKKNASQFQNFNGGRTFAHLRVCQAVEPVEAFGWKGAGTGMFSAFFNRDVAIGGSAGAGNMADAYLLRVRPETGTPAEYFSYYTAAWEPLTTVQVGPIDVKQADGTVQSITYTFKRAGSFGLILDTNPFYAEDWTTPDWRVGQEGANKFYFGSTPPADVDLRVLVSYRSALDPILNPGEVQASPERFLYRRAVGAYEVMHADSVADIQTQLVSHDFASGPNMLAADSGGRLFASSSSAIPKRGDEAGICAYGPTPHIDSIEVPDLYDQDDKEPVPARYLEDRVFDWVFVPLNPLPFPPPPASYPGDLKHLTPTGEGVAGNTSYQPYLFYDATQTSCADPDPCAPDPACPNHPAQVIALDNTYENPGFATMSNNDVHFAYKKSFELEAGSTCAVSCREWHSPDDQLLDYQLQTRTAYANRSPDAGSLEKNRHIIDTLINCVTGARPLMDCSAAKSFALDNRNYVPRDYAGYEDAAGVPSTPGVEAGYPIAVRNLTELRDNMTAVLDEAKREKEFFQDLWETLRAAPGWAASANRWVLGTQDVLWFPDYPNSSLAQTIALPDGYSLIDFLWSESRLGRKRLGDCSSSDCLLTAGLGGEQERFDLLVSSLEAWDGDPEFRNSKDSAAAGLLLEYDLGFNASTNGLANGSPVRMDEEGRIWTPVHDGFVWADATRFDQSGSYPASCSEIADPSTGMLPAGWLPEGTFTACSQNGLYLFRYYDTYKDFAGLMFSKNSLASVMYDCDSDTLCPDRKEHPITAIPKPPYDALYEDPLTRTVRSAPRQQDINALVQFFLVDLGGFTLTPERTDPNDPDSPLVPNGVSTTSKNAKIASWLAAGPKNKTLPYPYSYPLTRNLARVLLMRRLLETDDFLNANGLSTLGSILRCRVYDFAGNLRYPATEDGLPCDGGSIRAVSMHLEPDEEDNNGADAARGFQARIWAGGGSDKTMVVLFPYDGAKYPETFFLHHPGTRQSAFSSPHFVGMADHFRNRTMAPTHFTDYKSSPSFLSSDPIFTPQNPYLSPPN